MYNFKDCRYIWTGKRQANLLSALKESSSNCKDKKNKPFNLLDALSWSGSLQISSTKLHIVLALTHQFESGVVSRLVLVNLITDYVVLRLCQAQPNHWLCLTRLWPGQPNHWLCLTMLLPAQRNHWLCSTMLGVSD